MVTVDIVFMIVYYVLFSVLFTYNEKNNVKTFQFITMCKADMNHHEPKNNKNHFTRPS